MWFIYHLQNAWMFISIIVVHFMCVDIMFVAYGYAFVCVSIFVLFQQQICRSEKSEEQAVMLNWVEVEDEKRTRNLI